MTGVKRLTIVAAIMLVTAGCSQSPLSPSTPTIRFAVLVMGNISHRPVVDESVSLVLPSGIQRPYPETIYLTTKTDTQGIARWSVEPGHPYPVMIRGIRHFDGVVVVNDSQWLVSIPDR